MSYRDTDYLELFWVWIIKIITSSNKNLVPYKLCSELISLFGYIATLSIIPPAGPQKHNAEI